MFDPWMNYVTERRQLGDPNPLRFENPNALDSISLFLRFLESDPTFQIACIVEMSGGKRERDGKWFAYDWDDYLWKRFDLLRFEYFIELWLKANSYVVNQTNLNEIVNAVARKFAASINEFDKFDDQNPRINIEGGLLNVFLLQLEPPSPLHKCTYRLPVSLDLTNAELAFLRNNPEDLAEYLTFIPVRAPHFYRAMQSNPEAWKTLISYVQAILRNDYKLGLMLFLVGLPNTGKSTITAPFYQMLKPLATSMCINSLGPKENPWGLAELIGKHLIYDPDSATQFLYADSMRILKRLFGDFDVPLDVRIIYNGVRQVIFRLFAIICGNQLPQLPSTERMGMYKRSLVIEMTNQYNNDPSLRDGLLHEINQIFQYCILSPYVRLNPNANLAQHITEVESIWENWSNPLLMCFKMVFERSNNPEDFVSQQEVIDDVITKMEALGFGIPKRPEAQLTEKLKKLRITLVTRSVNKVNKKVYLGCKRIGSFSAPTLDVNAIVASSKKPSSSVSYEGILPITKIGDSLSNSLAQPDSFNDDQMIMTEILGRYPELVAKTEAFIRDWGKAQKKAFNYADIEDVLKLRFNLPSHVLEYLFNKSFPDHNTLYI